MPITQQRMLCVLSEAKELEHFALALHEDISDVLDRRDLSDSTKLIIIRILLEESKPPASMQIAIERDHFERSRDRNEKTKERMRRQRERRETNELE